MAGWAAISRHDRGYGSSWTKTRARILERDLHLCQPCIKGGRPTAAQEVDHIIPKADGGTDDDENLQAICRECHKVKTQQEAAKAQGRSYRPKHTIGADGWPVQG